VYDQGRTRVSAQADAGIRVSDYRGAMAHLRSLPRNDVVLAAVLAVYALVEGILLEAPPVWFVVALTATAALAWRRRYPGPVIAFALTMLFAPGLLGVEEVQSVLPLPLLIVCAFTVGREAPSTRAALLGAGLVGAAAAAGTAAGSAENTTAEDLVALLVLVSAGTGAGRVLRARQAETAQLRDLTARLAAEQDLRARAAVAEERARMARELHDIVAHSVSLIAVQAGAAEQLMGRDDARARESIRSVQETASGALGEMRRLLTVLRAADDVPGLGPQPGLAAVGELVEQARGGGLPVELREDGARPQVPPGVDLSAFRIIQEALTNVRRHAGLVATEVRVSYGEGEVVVEVVNEDRRPRAAAAGGPPGHGLLGMRERVRLYGGTLDVGRRDGRFVVAARLPLMGAAE
jgi:signal transduction histidine kinase